MRQGDVLLARSFIADLTVHTVLTLETVLCSFFFFSCHFKQSEKNLFSNAFNHLYVSIVC